MQALAKAAHQVAGKDALNISNTAQLRDICLAAARIFGWKGDSQVNVAVSADKAVVVCTPEKRAELQERLRRLQEEAAEDQAVSIAPATPQTQLPANVGAGNGTLAAVSNAAEKPHSPASPSAVAKAQAPSPSFVTWRDYEPPEPKPSPEVIRPRSIRPHSRGWWY